MNFFETQAQRFKKTVKIGHMDEIMLRVKQQAFSERNNDLDFLKKKKKGKSFT